MKKIVVIYLSFIFFISTQSYKCLSQEKEECYICYCNKVNLELPCKHQLCLNCVTKIQNINSKCPVCRKKFNTYKMLENNESHLNTSALNYSSRNFHSSHEDRTRYRTGFYSQRGRSEKHENDVIEELFSKIRNKRYEEVLTLLDTVRVDERNIHGNTAIHIAAQNGDKKIIKILLRKGANINAQNNTGQTALHYCFAYCYFDLAEYLLSKGADDTIVNTSGFDCYDGLR